ncbi:MAG: hypothetical protein WA941_20130 [Nitrososphaeraceae archaeon]
MSLRITSGFLIWLSICVKLIVLQLIVIILSSDSNVTHSEVASEEDNDERSLVSEEDDKWAVEAWTD